MATLTGLLLGLVASWLIGLNLALVQISHQRDIAQGAKESAEESARVANRERQRANQNASAAERARDLARYNEAIAHQTLALRIHRLIESLHPIGAQRPGP